MNSRHGRTSGPGQVVAVLAALLAAAGVEANFCSMDAVPAATLLFPYVAVDLKADGTPDPEGQTTITRVTNLSREAVIVHFTVWDVAGVARFCFDEILAGYDVVQINWRDVLNGRGDLFDTSRTTFPPASVPYTYDPFEWGPDGRGSKDALSAPANRSAVSATQCPGPPPYGELSSLGPTLRNLLSGSLVGRTHLGPCSAARGLRGDKTPYGERLGPSPLFFYVTADVVSACTWLTPSDPAYWTTVARTANVLVGDVIYLNARANTSEMMTAVHIEAAVEAGGVAAGRGFYEEKTGGVRTYREPLATALALNYGNDPNAGISSNIILWKNFTELDAVDDPAHGVWGKPLDCGSYVYYAWDMDERSLSTCTGCMIDALPYGGTDPNQFPFATQRVPLTNSYFDLPGTHGWMLIVLPPSYGPGFTDPTPDNRGYLQRPYMVWAALQLVYGRYSAGSQATVVANANCFSSQVLPWLGSNNGAFPVR